MPLLNLDFQHLHFAWDVKNEIWYVPQGQVHKIKVPRKKHSFQQLTSACKFKGYNVKFPLLFFLTHCS